ncbi:hypothetical protein ElyMa_006905100 [Elysia marginata]|uniref:U-box domain-containing protein n=1 Tax=Elysia marginata TaxID=1093978 RepID=A0AAV4JGZ7_9GAST|nr:hypothetical protein ElyMa_006905100 [Elysia marginata]
MTSVSLTVTSSQSHSLPTSSARDIPRYFTSHTIAKTAAGKLIQKPSRIGRFFRSLATFFIQLCPCKQTCLHNPATRDRIRLAAIILSALFGIFILLFSLGFGLGFIILSSVPKALIFASCSTIAPQIGASLYIPILLQERYPCRPYKDTPPTVTATVQPVQPQFWETINNQLEHLKACNGEDLAALYCFTQDLGNFHYLESFVPYREAAQWLENLLKHNPSLTTRLKAYAQQHDDSFLRNVNPRSQLSLDTIDNILNFLKTELSNLSRNETTTLKNTLATLVFNHLSECYRQALSFINTNTDQADTLNNTLNIHEMIDCVYQLRQCMKIHDLTITFQLPDYIDQAKDTYKKSKQLLQRLKIPLLDHCQKNGIQWGKIPLARAINNALPLFTRHTFTHRHLKCPITCDEIEEIHDPVINLVDQHLYEREDLEEWLMKKSTSPMNRDTCTQADIISLSTLINPNNFRIERLFS